MPGWRRNRYEVAIFGFADRDFFFDFFALFWQAAKDARFRKELIALMGKVANTLADVPPQPPDVCFSCASACGPAQMRQSLGGGGVH
jgi:hypothetical protein